MTVAATTASSTSPGGRARGVGAAAAARPKSGMRRWLGVAAVLGVLLVLWEVFKWLAGDPWRLHGTPFGLIRVDYEHVPPFSFRLANDLSLPHVWDIARAYVEPSRFGAPPLGLELIGAALFTLREALAGFAIGSLLGLGLGIVFVHSRLMERAFVPYVVASQTVPIIALAPIIVGIIRPGFENLGVGWLSVAVIATYLTFFPVTIAAVRGLRAADPRSFELMRSLAAPTRTVLTKLRLPASVPFLFGGFRIAAAASVVGAIIGELPTGIQDGLGGSILIYNQYYTSGPEKLWATIGVASLTSLACVGLVALGERLLTRGRYRPIEELA